MSTEEADKAIEMFNHLHLLSELMLATCHGKSMTLGCCNCSASTEKLLMLRLSRIEKLGAHVSMVSKEELDDAFSAMDGQVRTFSILYDLQMIP